MKRTTEAQRLKQNERARALVAKDKIKNGVNGIVCAFCGAEQKEIKFVIGAKGKDDDMFCMVEGTGKMACGKCYQKASKEGAEAIDRYIENHNKKAEQYAKKEKRSCLDCGSVVEDTVNELGVCVACNDEICTLCSSYRAPVGKPEGWYCRACVIRYNLNGLKGGTQSETL
jgi:hypothetical protein